jgi:hypothetical protein
MFSVDQLCEGQVVGHTSSLTYFQDEALLPSWRTGLEQDTTELVTAVGRWEMDLDVGIQVTETDLVRSAPLYLHS